MSGNIDCPKIECSRTFSSERGMKVHHSRAHGESIAGVEKTCPICQETFRTKQSQSDRRTCCSKECYAEHLSEERSGENHPSWQGGDVETECGECGAPITRIRAHYNRYDRHYCSTECESSWRKKHQSGENHPLWDGGKTEQTCDHCDDTYLDSSSNYRKYERTFCSRACFCDWCSESRVGENHPSWKGGYDGYYGPSWVRNRRAALERDGSTCQACGETSDLHVHHITPFRTFGLENHEDANALDNLVTLCNSCHGRWEGIPLRPDTAN